MARSLNKVQLIGNLTRDPELRYTPNGNAVCTFSLATNRYWTTDTGEKREEVDFHRIVAWNKLAELCSQFLLKGRKVYVEGRLSTRNWTGQDGQQRTTTEVVIDDMILLDSKHSSQGSQSAEGSAYEQRRKPAAEKTQEAVKKQEDEKPASHASEPEEPVQPAKAKNDEEVAPDDIPF